MDETKHCKVTFSFTCLQEWDAMEPTADERVRHCGTCTREVYLCQTEEESAAHGLVGLCVAMAPTRKWDGWTIGEVDPLIRWYGEGAESAEARRRAHTPAQEDLAQTRATRSELMHTLGALQPISYGGSTCATAPPLP